MPSTLIDIHPHIVSSDTQRYPLAPLHGKRSDWSSTRSKAFEEVVAGMNSAAIDKACIVHSSTTYGFDNSYVADTVEANPSRFTGVFSVDMTAPDAAAKVRHWVGRGLTGIRVYTGGSTFAEQSGLLSDPITFPAWDAAVELGITITVQLRPEGLSQLLTMIRRYPQARILIDNLLRPNYQEGPPYYGSEHTFCLARYHNVHMKIITNSVRDARKGKGTPETFFPRLVQEFGAQRIAWGSNYPASEGTLKEIVDEAKGALSCLSQNEQHWIFAQTAQTLFPTLADE
ncbi:amidohydrolase family protein [Aminobacter sp. AP02]|uniref:amidohydrolase family protein n=1 Tax=Aminobacter sp. AP02 TaxID=2135737 RepID=UPI000D6B51BF|nr:amidohydrolase family protein [Aminobacter sp. AP02]PWK61300.1 putative TIM-barrel fold metal-dependent hydrolase [Aminobacter sp. AP02]